MSKITYRLSTTWWSTPLTPRLFYGGQLVFTKWQSGATELNTCGTEKQEIVIDFGLEVSGGLSRGKGEMEMVAVENSFERLCCKREAWSVRWILTLCIYGLCRGGFYQPWIANIWKKNCTCIQHVQVFFLSSSSK
jgi:hypothetical protein